MADKTDTQPARPEPDEAQARKDAQEAQQAEAQGKPRSFDFDGHTYDLLDGQPSPRALTYVARWQVDDENLALVLGIREMIGDYQWDLWCDRHKSEQMLDFWLLLNKVAGGGEGN